MTVSMCHHLELKMQLQSRMAIQQAQHQGRGPHGASSPAPMKATLIVPGLTGAELLLVAMQRAELLLVAMQRDDW